MRRAWIALAVGAALAACRQSRGERQSRDFERMRQQQRYDLYGRSRFFPNGAVVQSPPAHTISRAASLAAGGQTASLAFLTGSTAGSYVTTIPLSIDDRLRALGARQFAISCAPCHGAAGFGGGPIAPNLVEKRPASLRTPAIAALSPGMLFAIVTNGFGRMPPYGWQMPPSTRWAVIGHVRSLAAEPPSEAARADSTTAAYLGRVDSLRAAGADVHAIVGTPTGRR